MAQESTNAKGRLGSAEGRITIQSKPAPGISLELYPIKYLDILEDPIATTTTDEDGKYKITGLPANNYWLKVLAPEYVNASGWSYEGVGRRISVPTGQAVQNADLDLILGGAISGRIKDPDGKPVIGEFVFLTPIGVFGPSPASLHLTSDDFESFETNSDGTYRMIGIPPGRYLVGIGVDVARVTGKVRDRHSFNGSGRIDEDHYYEQTFYPGVSDKSRAKVVEISAGSVLKNINFSVGKLLRAYSVSGRVVEADSGKPISGCYIQVGIRIGVGYRSTVEVSEENSTGDDGQFKVIGLLPGRFFLNAYFDKETDLQTQPVEFEVKDNDISGLEVKAHRGLTISGSIVVEGSKEAVSMLQGLELRAECDPEGNDPAVQRIGKIDSSGDFIIGGLCLGRVKIMIWNSPVSQFFSLVRVEYPNSEDKNKIEIARGDHFRDEHGIPLKSNLERVRIILAYNRGRIIGHVRVIGGKLDPGTRLTASIYQEKDGGGWSTSRELNADGEFMLDGLEPGTYQIEIRDGIKTLTERKAVQVGKDGEARVIFNLNLDAKR